MAKKKLQSATAETSNDSLLKAFFGGFFLPIRFLGRGLVWLTHQFPLKHIGHIIRWFANLRLIRFFGRIIGARYLRDSWKELSSVTWPTFRESVRLTTAVIIFSIVFGIFVTIIDYGLDKVFKQFLLK